MSEKPPRIENKETPIPQNLDQVKQAKYSMEDYPAAEMQPLSPEASAEKVAELERMYESFESRFPLELLRTIQASTIEELRANEMREAARQDLPAMATLINFIEKQQEVPEAVFLGLLLKHKLIQAAVGTFNNGRLDHSVREGWIKVP